MRANPQPIEARYAANALFAGNKNAVEQYGWRAVRKGKIAIVHPTLAQIRKTEHLEIPIYALPEVIEAREFSRKKDATRIGGPAHELVGTVGRVSAKILPTAPNSEKKALYLRFAQAAFRSGKEAGEHALPRKLATKYGGWRVHALAEAIRIAHELECEFVIHPYSVTEEFMTRKQPFHEESAFGRDLKRAAEKAGATIIRERNEYGPRVRIIPGHE